MTFRNLGWSADTVFADSRGIFDKPDVGFLRMVEHIRAVEPTVAFICHGQNEALTAGMTTEKYSQQLGRLLDELAASGIACVLVSPHELLPTLPPIPSPARFNSKIWGLPPNPWVESAVLRSFLVVESERSVGGQRGHPK